MIVPDFQLLFLFCLAPDLQLSFRLCSVDDDLGSLPLLTYFLCERHTHYVDVMWNSEDLTFMAEFLLGHISILFNSNIPEKDRIVAVNNLYGALLSYPPHR